MSLPAVLSKLRLPVIAAPMFIASGPELVSAQCRSGIVGSFPSLNALPPELLDSWLTELTAQRQRWLEDDQNAVIGPIAVNQILHQSNHRVYQDMAVCVKHRVPIIITSLRAPPKELLDAVHEYGGIVLHDVICIRHAEKALEAGVDGLIAVAAGAGGHASMLSPFALIGEIRRFFDGPLVLSGSIATGDAILAAQAFGADLAYVGTRFLATSEANVTEVYKQDILESHAADIVYSSAFTGVKGNYLRASIKRAGLDPDNLPEAGKEKLGAEAVKAWRDVFGAGQGVGLIDDVSTTAAVVNRLESAYRAARARLTDLSVKK